jgi:hypothetical protein
MNVPARTLAAFAFVLINASIESNAYAQACCAGTGALTPGRLALHEDALVGTQIHTSRVLGAFDDNGHYTSSPSGSSEDDFEQDLFGAVRVFHRGQVALLVPLVETYRTSHGVREFGGGIGDVNLSLRYDFTLAGVSRTLPGIALLVGITAPTGTPPESAHKLLATDATGAGAWQANAGIAFEQTFGPWLVNATELVAWRAPRSIDGIDEALGPQLVTLIGTAYTFPSEAALALFGSYTIESGATIDGQSAPDSKRHIVLISVAGIYPLTDQWRIQGSVFANPPISSFGRNQTATTGITITILRTWS